MLENTYGLCTGLLQWGHVSMLRARKFMDAAVLGGGTIDSVLEQVPCRPRSKLHRHCAHCHMLLSAGSCIQPCSILRCCSLADFPTVIQG